MAVNPSTALTAGLRNNVPVMEGADHSAVVLFNNYRAGLGWPEGGIYALPYDLAYLFS